MFLLLHISSPSSTSFTSCINPFTKLPHPLPSHHISRLSPFHNINRPPNKEIACSKTNHTGTYTNGSCESKPPAGQVVGSTRCAKEGCNSWAEAKSWGAASSRFCSARKFVPPIVATSGIPKHTDLLQNRPDGPPHPKLHHRAGLAGMKQNVGARGCRAWNNDPNIRVPREGWNTRLRFEYLDIELRLWEQGEVKCCRGLIVDAAVATCDDLTHAFCY